MKLPVELRALIIGIVAFIIYMAIPEKLYALILAALFIAMYLILLGYEQRVQR